MKKQKLILEQTDKKIAVLKKSEGVVAPSSGWIYAIRHSLGMSMRHLGERMGITPQSVKDLESREKEGAVSLKVLNQVAKALDMKLVYGFVPADGSLEEMIEKRALQLAKEIVNRTSVSMILEDQGVSESQLKKAIREKAEELKNEMPGMLWDL